ncbi:MAG: response regulator transcription factor [Ktedonobacterales bacterium]
MSNGSTDSARERGRLLDISSSPRIHTSAAPRSRRMRRPDTVLLPRWPAGAATSGATASATTATHGALALLEHPLPDATAIPIAARHHILIVEDDSQVASVIRAGIELEGEADWSVQSAGEGLRALEMAGATPPDVVLLDVRLPGLGGAEVYRRLRASQKTRGARILFLSAGTGFDLHQLGIEDGVLLRKPFDVRNLVGLVRALLQG